MAVKTLLLSLSLFVWLFLVFLLYKNVNVQQKRLPNLSTVKTNAHEKRLGTQFVVNCICENEINTSNYSKNYLIIVVHSARQYFLNREAIRDTYGSISTYKNYIIQIVFFVGLYDPNRKLMESEQLEEARNLWHESNMFKDVVFGDFIDSYRNLSLKHITALQWATKSCPNANWIIKVDDDVYLDLPKFIDSRIHDVHTLQMPSLYCLFANRTKPLRNEASKWYLSFQEYPEEYFPDYCFGAVYAADPKVVIKLLNYHNPAKILWIDDVYVTGILVEKAKKYDEEMRNLVIYSIWKNVSKGLPETPTGCNNTDWINNGSLKEVTLVKRDIGKPYMNCLWNAKN